MSLYGGEHDEHRWKQPDLRYKNMEKVGSKHVADDLISAGNASTDGIYWAGSESDNPMVNVRAPDALIGMMMSKFGKCYALKGSEAIGPHQNWLESPDKSPSLS